MDVNQVRHRIMRMLTDGHRLLSAQRVELECTTSQHIETIYYQLASNNVVSAAQLNHVNTSEIAEIDCQLRIKLESNSQPNSKYHTKSQHIVWILKIDFLSIRIMHLDEINIMYCTTARMLERFYLVLFQQINDCDDCVGWSLFEVSESSSSIGGATWTNIML